MVLQVFSRAEPIEYEWQLNALPWWQTWPAQYGAGVMRLPALKPAENAARGLQRLLRLNNYNNIAAAEPSIDPANSGPTGEPSSAPGVQPQLRFAYFFYAGGA